MLTNTRTIRVQWGDCDPAGIVSSLSRPLDYPDHPRSPGGVAQPVFPGGALATPRAHSSAGSRKPDRN